MDKKQRQKKEERDDTCYSKSVRNDLVVLLS